MEFYYMQVRIRLKSVAAVLALLVCYTSVVTVPTVVAGAETLDMQEPYVEEVETTETYEVTDWWKAELSEYSEDLVSVSYEESDIVQTNTDEDIEDISTAATTEATTAQTTQAAPAVTEIAPVKAPSGSFVITTFGYGHGVGMSQNGANYYATYGGLNYKQILAHYYQGTTIANTGLAQTEQVKVDGMTGSVVDLVSQVVYNEINCTMHPEAMKAQAVAAYTYIKYHGNNGKDLRRKANPPQNVVDAVTSVLGEAVYYNGNFALTSFYASCGGASASCKDIFTQDIPYLRSVASEYDAACDPNYGTQTVFTAATLKNALERSFGIHLSENPAAWIQLVQGDGGYASYVVIDNQITIKGSAFRDCLGLKSPKLTCTYTP